MLSQCDGTRPRCLTCEELGFDCVYLQSASSSNVIVGKEYLVTLERRLQTVEETLLKERNFKARPTQVPLPRGQRQPQSDESYDPSCERQVEGISVNNQDVQGQIGSGNPTDGMGAIVFTGEEDFGYFGPSSNIAFTRHISHAVARVSHISGPMGTSGNGKGVQQEGGIISVSRPSSPSCRSGSNTKGARDRQVDYYALPSDADTLTLIQRYFSNTGLLYPYLHEGMFLATYTEMKRNNFTKIRRTWLGLLNMVLALATNTTVRTDVRAEKRMQESDVFYQRAVGLCDKQIMRGTSLEIVQYLLLMGQYLQGTQKSVQAWTIHGLTTKAAFQLGLHSNEALKTFSPLEHEVRKRTWYGCVILDRTLSMTFGRPAAIPDDYVKVDPPVDYVNILQPASPDESVCETGVPFFNATITLYKVLWDVIDSLYGGNIGCDKPINLDTISRIFQIEHQLVGWERTLPIDLKLIQSGDIPLDEGGSRSSERFRVILSLRYHNLRILLHRPILVKFLDASGKPDSDHQELALLQQVGSNSIQICVKSCIEIISIVHIIVHSTGERRCSLGAWWFSLYYTFNAALVIFASSLICREAGPISPSLFYSTAELQVYSGKAVEALRLLDQGNRMVEKCCAYLEQLVNVLSPLSPTNETRSAGVLAMPENLSPRMPVLGDNVSSPKINLLDLGEFMIEGDLEFLNHFSISNGG